ncbi:MULTISPECIES: hypothetical protein [Mycobacterium]|uniref:hypothetical protein n=1 Tax=Mycobacterium TaxID=1763 RepID=UPI0002FEA985|nr:MULTISPECIES: hypothetical protein [Mycobacterium]MDM3894356.1 hypothetical protein [Mycobacterium intracellulare]UGT98375.1 hypothetical protein LTQ55_07275 [Mycobacterium intracellulare]UGU03215.1 hypothetical protein LTS63_05615 [Mycobacterium intracellulare]UGU07906.1 hypothetical protein LTQ56_04245 [Mycobacterium intracellulare subsp. intracellulare]WSE45052.1 hypothetical protein QGN30_18045 [Mycobacterium sp. 3-98]
MTENAKPLADNELGAARLPRSGMRERGLDWNVVTLPPNGEIDTTPGADVLIHVLSGSGRLDTEEGTNWLTAGALLWLPRRSRPQLTAGGKGLRYLTVNQKWEILPP